jgi:hypothetical protein
MIATKICAVCAKRKPLILFWRDIRMPGGREKVCKVCRKTLAKQHRGVRGGSRYLAAL